MVDVDRLQEILRCLQEEDRSAVLQHCHEVLDLVSSELASNTAARYAGEKLADADDKVVALVKVMAFPTLNGGPFSDEERQKVVLTSIKAVREVTGLGLKDAKDIVDRVRFIQQEKQQAKI